jgi:hypothetical protein
MRDAEEMKSNLPQMYFLSDKEGKQRLHKPLI